MNTEANLQEPTIPSCCKKRRQGLLAVMITEQQDDDVIYPEINKNNKFAPSRRYSSV